MSKIITANFVTPSPETQSLIQRMARFDLDDRLELIGNEFGHMGFRTSFSLADQVLTHALIKGWASVDFVVDLDADKSKHVLDSLHTLTRETYGLSFEKRLSNQVEAVLVSDNVDRYIAKDKVRSLLTINPLADWNHQALVEYVLAHEVPVDPSDMQATQPELKPQAA